MKKAEFLRQLEHITLGKPGTLKGTEILSAIGWDSMAIVEFQTLLDSEFGTRIPVERIVTCRTVGDLAALLGDKLSD